MKSLWIWSHALRALWGLKELDADFEFIPRRAGPAEPRFRHFRGPAVSKAGDWTDCFILGQSGERPER
jgi:hypothetical protein